ncbi:alpha-mannosidase [Anaeramoeba flamelloides]|uniref:Alpha-mannosidase n=1 Tax=Anaeramoeba flamelloides TaxID=1746091 RepID=A0ABQ8Z817_9EUKA|nr:alpha-mannosidase [Anaeramoeba flamelloides]
MNKNLNCSKFLFLFLVSFFLIQISCEDHLDVYIVPHTHDDPAWDWTFDQYYNDKVKDILDYTIANLNTHPDHKFMYVEISFFAHWWEQQNSTTKETVIRLLDNKQFELVNGGWVMHDEANPTYGGMIDQMTFGHSWIANNIGPQYIPKVAFHIDPFGHSDTDARIFSEMCMEYFVLDRIPFSDKSAWMDTGKMEFDWYGSHSLQKDQNSIFAYVCPPFLYGTPSPFNFEGDPDFNQPITDLNVEEKSWQLVSIFRERAKGFLHPHLMFLFGGDFHFTRPWVEFENMDKLINYINSNPDKYNVSVQYGTPYEYFTIVKNWRKNNQKIEFPQRGPQDFFTYFFAYIPTKMGYWSGYYTSWPLLKGAIAKAQRNLRAFEMANMLFHEKPQTYNTDLNVLRDAVGITMHHDAITGTSKPYVNEFQYLGGLKTGILSAQPIFFDSIAEIIQGKNNRPVLTNDPSVIIQLLQQNNVAPLIVYNPTSWSINDPIVQIPLPNYKLSTNFKIISSDYIDVRSINWDPNNEILSFRGGIINIPALGFTTFFISIDETQKNIHQINNKNNHQQEQEQEQIEEQQEEIQQPQEQQQQQKETQQKKQKEVKERIKNKDNSKIKKLKSFPIENLYWRLEFDDFSNTLVSITNLKTKKTSNVKNTIYYYESGLSGAYIFANLFDSPFVLINPEITVNENDVYSEVIQKYQDNLYQTFRLYHTQNEFIGGMIEIELHCGPNLPGNKEYITRFETDIENKKILYTKNNGLETGKREYLDLDTQAIPANYHPFPSAAWINGTNTNTKNEEEILLIAERAHGAGSINEGQIEVMVARRTLQDDGFGLGMPLVDTTEFKTKLWLSIDTHYSNKNKRQAAATILPLFSDNLHMSSSYPVISKSSEWSTKFLTEKSELCITLPGYIHILTISKTFDQQSKGILRIQHLSEFDEGSPYTVNLNKLFSCSNTFNPSNFQEMSLSLSNTIDTCHSSNKNIKPNPKAVSEITIKPMEIRTFIFDYSN